MPSEASANAAHTPDSRKALTILHPEFQRRPDLCVCPVPPHNSPTPPPVARPAGSKRAGPSLPFPQSSPTSWLKAFTASMLLLSGLVLARKGRSREEDEGRRFQAASRLQGLGANMSVWRRPTASRWQNLRADCLSQRDGGAHATHSTLG